MIEQKFVFNSHNNIIDTCVKLDFLKKIIEHIISDGIKCKVYLKAAPTSINGRSYLKLQQMKMDFSVKNIQMGVDNVHNGNAVIRKFEIV